MNPAIAVYTALLTAWNNRDAAAFAALFTADGHATGFDGSQMNGASAIASELAAIFAGHPTNAYVAKVREIRQLAPTVTLLRAAAGMIPPGSSTPKADVNAIQNVVLVKTETDGELRIAMFQNTPAAFHGRPELVTEMTQELTRVHESGLVVAAEL